MDKDAAKCDICRRPVVWPSHYGDWECPHCHQRYEYDEGLKITLTDAQWALLRNPPRWIPVSERLPTHDTRVLVAAKQRDGEVVVKEMLFVDWSLPPEPPAPAWSDDYGGEEFESVTHWMPLPKPPEVK
jgi:hypothetical protein